MVNHSSRRVNKLVYNQYQEPISLAIATSDSLTCLYRLNYLNKIKRLGSSRRRHNKLKRFILSPQSLIDLGVKTFNNAAYYITNIRYGLQVNSSYRFLGIKGRVSYHNAANRYIVDRINIFTEEDLIKLELEKHFGPHGLKYPVVGLIYKGGLTSEEAREAYVNNRPYKNVCMPEVCAEHAVVITGIYTDGEPERHFVEIKNCYGSEWGYEGYTKVVFGFIRSVMIPCIDDKKCMEKKSVIKMAEKKCVGSLKESKLKGKRVLVRSDLNVPLDDSFKITDDTRIRAVVPTIKYLMSNGARVILSSHLGRPKGVTAKLSLKPLVPRLSELLGIEVKMADDCVGPVVEKSVTEIPEGGVLLLENLRFYKEEENNDPEFAKKLASLADLYVNDAFGTAHRTHASTEGVAKHLNLSHPQITCFAAE